MFGDRMPPSATGKIKDAQLVDHAAARNDPLILPPPSQQQPADPKRRPEFRQDSPEIDAGSAPEYVTTRPGFEKRQVVVGHAFGVRTVITCASSMAFDRHDEFPRRIDRDGVTDRAFASAMKSLAASACFRVGVAALATCPLRAIGRDPTIHASASAWSRLRS